MAGYIGTQAVSVNTTSATISDDLAVGDDATITGDLDVDGTTNLDVVDIDGAVDMASTLQLDGAVTLGVAGTSNGFINSPSGIFVNIDSDNNQTDRFFDIRKDSTDGSGTLLFQVAETGAVNIPATALVTGVLTTTAAAVFNGGFTSNGTAATFASSTANSPNIIFKNTTNDANAPIMDFITDKGAAGADNDSLGLIRFTGDNDAQQQTTFARVLATVSDASDGAEGGKLELQVATHDGEIKSGLIVNDGNVEDEIDVTIGFGAASLTSVAGNLNVNGTLQTASGLVHLGDTNTSHDMGTDTQSFFTGGVRSLDFTTSSVVVNEDGANIDFRVASNNKTNMLVVDAGEDVVTINNIGTDKRFRVDSVTLTTAAFNYGDSSDVALMQLKHAGSAGSTARTMIQFLDVGGTERGTIKTTGSGTAYAESSDYRLKENVVYDWDATTRLKQLKPARFNFIGITDTTVDGFLAHEAQAVVPECATGTHNEVDDAGNAVMQGIDRSRLVPLLVKTIQELEARITALEG